MITGCPICHTENYTVVYNQTQQFAGASIVRCSNCEHIYTLLKEEVETASLYNDEVYKVVENRESVYDKIINREYSGVIFKLTLFQKDKGSLLDFGCGKGKFGSIAQQQGWQVKCVETSPERAAYAREVYHLDVSTDFFTAGNIFNTQFNAITLFHVLEHLPDPVGLFTELVKGNADKNAVIVVEVPNFNSLQSRIAGNKWIHLDVPRHINHFTGRQLENLLYKNGFLVLDKSHYSEHLGVLGMTDSLLKLFGYKKNIIYELKNKKSRTLKLKIALLLPFALLMENIAAAFGKGGIIRLYLKQKV